MAKLIYGHGINDKLRPAKINGKRLIQYELWIGMIRRCYSTSDREKFKSYEGCEVSEKFKRYSYFYDWYNLNIVNNNVKYDLDKDLLIKGNRIYSENSCLLIPREINNLIQLKKSQRGDLPIGVSRRKDSVRLVSQISLYGGNKTLGYFSNEIDAFNAYKQYKEKHIKFLANKYSSVINEKAYNALMNYTVEITD